MNGFYILAHDSRKLKNALDTVNIALSNLEFCHESNIFV
jgi:hypothetical protein